MALRGHRDGQPRRRRGPNARRTLTKAEKSKLGNSQLAIVAGKRGTPTVLRRKSARDDSFQSILCGTHTKKMQASAVSVQGRWFLRVAGEGRGTDGQTWTNIRQRTQESAEAHRVRKTRCDKVGCAEAPGSHWRLHVLLQMRRVTCQVPKQTRGTMRGDAADARARTFHADGWQRDDIANRSFATWSRPNCSRKKSGANGADRSELEGLTTQLRKTQAVSAGASAEREQPLPEMQEEQEHILLSMRGIAWCCGCGASAVGCAANVAWTVWGRPRSQEYKRAARLLSAGDHTELSKFPVQPKVLTETKWER